ncbi:MAG: response regulator transcription factor [Hyphomicrobiales bacterium]|nr:response regulator transcription factor [Hyphomicrobiales bacterium]
MNGMRILLVEDSHSLRQVFSSYFSQQGCHVDEIGSLSGARRLLKLFKPDLAIVDLGLNDGIGLDLLSDLTARDIPAVIISSRSDSRDRVLSFEMGAEDFMVKPIDLRELHLRAVRLLRSRKQAAMRETILPLSCGAATVDVTTRTLQSADLRRVALTGSEFRLLRLLLEKRGAVVDRGTISVAVLNHRFVENSRAVDVMVSKLRCKLAKVGEARAIRNVRAEGYVFEPDLPSTSPVGT